ncbi:MAG: hypothetical protein H6925_00500 [Holosporaceae bacterium]|nr:MAG: hypothetical protein H6925_00500 [Holosporaceae bacterium]
MRTAHLGRFDAVITIFNAVGHLTIEDFGRAMHNIYQNLNSGGIYVFDIFNLECLLCHDNIKQLTIDWEVKEKDKIHRQIQYSVVTSSGILSSYTTHHHTHKNGQVFINREAQTLQVYSLKMLERMLQKNGFSVLQTLDIEGGAFVPKDSQRLLVVAQKKKK